MDKGIILAGGAGSRLYPLTRVASKQLQPVYDKPMLYYPLTTLMLAGVRHICLISTPHDLPRIETLLGSGEQWGMTICYREQPKPEGIAQAFLIGEDFIGDDPVSLILGDNIFYGHYDFKAIFSDFRQGGHVFAYRVHDPERYGVVEFNAEGRVLSIEEKPKKPRSHYAIPGIYLFDNDVVGICKALRPSGRGELEITDVNKAYLERGLLTVSVLGRGIAWLDTGTNSSLHAASEFVSLIERRQGLKIGCPEEIALRMGFIDLDHFKGLIKSMPTCEYSDYLKQILLEFEEQIT